MGERLKEKIVERRKEGERSIYVTKLLVNYWFFKLFIFYYLSQDVTKSLLYTWLFLQIHYK